MNHLIMSPHADDAVASCGGLIAHCLAAGEGVTVYTIFCGQASPPYSPGALELHRLWGDPRDVVRLRRAEDEAAAARLGANLCHGNFMEAIYRRNGRGDWLYPDIDQIFRARHPHDEPLVAELVESVESQFDSFESRLYVPLGIGEHVDHQLVFEAGNRFREDGKDVVFYEDFPYTARPSSHERRMAALDRLSAATVILGEDELLAKIEAFGYYRSQIDMLFGDARQMPVAFIDYARTVAGRDGRFGERYWFDEGRENPFS